MLKRILQFVLFISCGLLSNAQEKVDFTKLPDWLWGEYIYANGSWPMDLHKDFIILSGQLSGYVTETTLENDVYCLTVTDFKPNNPVKKAWLKLVAEDTISISMDNKRFVQLTKPQSSRFKRIDLQEYLKPIKGKWYAADKSTLYAEFGEDSVLLNGEKYAYDYVVQDGKTIQLNLSGSPYGRFIQLEKYTDLYMKIRASGMNSRICKRKPEMPFQVSNEFSDIPTALTGTFYTTDGENSKWTFNGYQFLMNNDTFPLSKLRLNDGEVHLKFKEDKRTIDIFLNPYNDNYVYFKNGNDDQVFLKRRIELPDGIEMENPFMGTWYSTKDESEFTMDARRFSGKSIGKAKFDQVLFTGDQFECLKAGRLVASIVKLGEDYMEITSKKGTVLYKNDTNAPNYVSLAILPENFIQNWYASNGEFVYGIGDTYVAYNKRFWDVNEIRYQDQQYQLSISYDDTICYYNESGDYVCEIKHDKKELALNQSTKNVLTLSDLHHPNSTLNLSNVMGTLKSTDVVMKYNGPAVLIGHVDDHEKLKNQVLTIYSEDLLYDEQMKYTATIDSNGFFKFEIPLLNTKSVWSILKVSEEIILTPNDTVLITTNESNLSVPAKWNMMGPNVALTKEVATLFMDWSKNLGRDRYNEREQRYGLEPEQFAIFMDSLHQSDINYLNHYIQNNNSSAVLADYWKTRIDINDWNNRMRFRWVRASQAGVTSFEEHPTYFSFLDSIEFADEKLWLYNDFQNLVHEVYMRDTRLFSPLLNAKELFGAIIEKDTTLSAENIALLSDISRINKPSQTERDTVTAIINRNSKIIEQLKADKLKDEAKSITMTEKGLVLTDIFACNKYFNQLQAARNIEQGWKELTIKVSDERFLKHMKIVYEKELAMQNKELPEYALMNYPAKTSGDQFLKTLAEKHAGFVVYIDFWAPWCGPCRSEMEHAPEVKKALKDKPVHFVYLCGSGGEEAQESCIKKYKLEGDHYYLENTTYQQITGKFNITGIPTYMIMDKNGRIVDQKAPRPSNLRTLLQTLEKYIKEVLEEEALSSEL